MSNRNSPPTRKRFKPGDTIPSFTRIITTEEILYYSKRAREFGGLPTGIKSIHNDEKMAQSYGLRGVVAPGIQTLAYIWMVMKGSFQQSWINGGSVSVKFTNMVCGGDELITHGTVREPKDDEPNDRIHIDTWMENQFGEKVIVGQVSVPIS